MHALKHNIDNSNLKECYRKCKATIIQLCSIIFFSPMFQIRNLLVVIEHKILTFVNRLPRACVRHSKRLVQYDMSINFFFQLRYSVRRRTITTPLTPQIAITLTSNEIRPPSPQNAQSQPHMFRARSLRTSSENQNELVILTSSGL